MRFLILAKSRRSFTTRRLVEAAKGLKHRVEVRSPSRFSLGFGEAISVNGEAALPVHAVIPRFGTSVQTYGFAVLSQLEQMGLPALNTAPSIELVRNRVRCMQALIRHGVPVPRALLVSRGEVIEKAIESVGGFPVMLRRVSGKPTLGALFCESDQGCLAALEALWSLGHEVLLTEHFHETQGEGVRCLVIDGEVVAAVRRKGRIVRTRFRFERRSKAIEVLPPRALKELMARVANATGLRVAGVDVLETDEGYKVLEVNAAPGIEQLETATGRDLAKLIVEAACRLVSVRGTLSGVRAPRKERRA